MHKDFFLWISQSRTRSIFCPEIPIQALHMQQWIPAEGTWIFAPNLKDKLLRAENVISSVLLRQILGMLKIWLNTKLIAIFVIHCWLISNSISVKTNLGQKDFWFPPPSLHCPVWQVFSSFERERARVCVCAHAHTFSPFSFTAQSWFTQCTRGTQNRSPLLCSIKQLSSTCCLQAHNQESPTTDHLKRGVARGMQLMIYVEMAMRPTLGLFQRQHCGNFWEIGWRTVLAFPQHLTRPQLMNFSIFRLCHRSSSDYATGHLQIMLQVFQPSIHHSTLTLWQWALKTN